MNNVLTIGAISVLFIALILIGETIRNIIYNIHMSRRVKIQRFSIATKHCPKCGKFLMPLVRQKFSDFPFKKYKINKLRCHCGWIQSIVIKGR